MAPTADSPLYDVFLSYSTEDRDIAERIHRSLADRKLQVFRDARSIAGGDNIVLAISDGLASTRAFLLLISPAALASRWVEHEWATALWLHLERGSSIRVIPVMIRPGALLPALLRPFRFVDFRPPANFDESLEELASAIAGTSLPPRILPASCPPELSFLRYFPEGLLPGVYGDLVAATAAGDSSRLAEEAGILVRVHYRGWELLGLDPAYLQEIWAHGADEVSAARSALSLLEQSFAASDPFAFEADEKIGLGRALLLRDLVDLVGVGAADDEDETAWDRRWSMQRLAQQLLPLLLDEGESRIGMEIGRRLLRSPFVASARASLVYALALADIGRPVEALEIFESYRGEGLFDEPSLTVSERVAAIQNWAKALKDAGQARQRHAELVPAYGTAIALLQSPDFPGDQDPRHRLADLFLNRATQLAVFGAADDWIRALADLHAAEEQYRKLDDPRGLLATWSETVAHTLDHLAPGEAPPGDLLSSLAGLEQRAEALPPADLFFFLYQKARLLRHLGRAGEAEDEYLNAENVARQGELPHRAALARLAVARLRRATPNGQEAFESELAHATSTLAAYPEDSWSRNTLRHALPELARIRAAKPDREGAAKCALQALALELARFRGDGEASGRTALRAALSLVDEVAVAPELRVDFLDRSQAALRLLLGKPRHAVVRWEHLKSLAT